MHGAMTISLLDAVRGGDQESAKRILSHNRYTNIELQTTKKDGTALFWCCCHGYRDLVHLLLLHGADVNSCTAWGASPLHACADHNHLDILKLLLHFGADINLQTKNGDTACHLASYRGFIDCVRILVEHGANLELRNNKRHTPIQEAYTMRQFDVYKYLLNGQKQVKQQDKQNGQSIQLMHDTVKPSACCLAASPSGYYGYPSERYSSFQTSDNKTTLLSSNSDYPNSNSESSILNSSISPSKNGLSCSNMETTKVNNIIGVLRVRHYEHNDGDFTNSCKLSCSCTNDLSSIDVCVMPSLVSRKSILSFKNI